MNRRAITDNVSQIISIVVLFVIATGLSYYILQEQRLRIPVLEEKPFELKAEFETAQAVVPGQGQTVRVAGVRIGDVQQVELEDGIGVVTFAIDPEFTPVYRDATVLMRLTTGLKDMFFDLDPGTQESGEFAEGDRIPLANTAPDVNLDEILAALDADTRSYLRLLLVGAGKGLEGRGEDLRQTFKRLEPLHRDLAAVNTSVARRRVSLKKLINDYGSLTEELGSKDEDLTRLVRAGNDTFSALAAEEFNLSETVRRLPGALRETQRTLSRVDTLGGELGPALEALRPAVRRLDETNAAVLPFVREAEPIVRTQIRPFTRIGQPYLRRLGGAARGISRAAPDLTTTVFELNRLFNMGAFNPGGKQALTGNDETDRRREEGYLYWLAWAAQNGVSLHNTADAQGVQRRLTLCGLTTDTALDQLGPGLADAIGEGTTTLPEILKPSGGLLQSIVGSDFSTCEFRPPSG